MITYRMIMQFVLCRKQPALGLATIPQGTAGQSACHCPQEAQLQTGAAALLALDPTPAAWLGSGPDPSTHMHWHVFIEVGPQWPGHFKFHSLDSTAGRLPAARRVT